MLVPRTYRPRRASDVLATVRANPLALVATNGPGTPFATHAPVIVEQLASGSGPVGYADVDDVAGSLDGASLLAHMNLTNDHWLALQRGANVLVVFQGPHAYISPAAYAKRPAAPTWNFITVHLRGRVEPIAPGPPTLEVVTATVRALERLAGTGWDMTHSVSYFRQIQPGVGAFRVHVESVEAMFKLSQEHSPEVRDSIREHLSAQDRGLSREVSEAMRAEESDSDSRDRAAGASAAAAEVTP